MRPLSWSQACGRYWRFANGLESREVCLCSAANSTKKTSSVYDCTVEDVEYIYNKLSIHIFNSKSR